MWLCELCRSGSNTSVIVNDQELQPVDSRGPFVDSGSLDHVQIERQSESGICTEEAKKLSSRTQNVEYSFEKTSQNSVQVSATLGNVTEGPTLSEKRILAGQKLISRGQLLKKKKTN